MHVHVRLVGEKRACELLEIWRDLQTLLCGLQNEDGGAGRKQVKPVGAEL